MSIRKQDYYRAIPDGFGFRVGSAIRPLDDWEQRLFKCRQCDHYAWFPYHMKHCEKEPYRETWDSGFLTKEQRWYDEPKE